jgi:hypothetical protein
MPNGVCSRRKSLNAGRACELSAENPGALVEATRYAREGTENSLRPWRGLECLITAGGCRGADHSLGGGDPRLDDRRGRCKSLFVQEPLVSEKAQEEGKLGRHEWHLVRRKRERLCFFSFGSSGFGPRSLEQIASSVDDGARDANALQRLSAKNALAQRWPCPRVTAWSLVLAWRESSGAFIAHLNTLGWRDAPW